MKKIIILLLLSSFNQKIFAQNNFVENCIGNWSGTMYIFSKGNIVDSVKVKLTIAITTEKDVWTWKTEYLSEKMPMTKDYKLRVKDKAKGIYLTDEGDGLMLEDYLFENKMYSVFEVQGILLTSSYELRNQNELIFEVTSGKKIEQNSKEVTNFTVNNLQRVVFRRNK
jgi:hypothetical protein